MKTKTTLFILGFLLISSMGFAQKKNAPISIITGKTNIAKYHHYDDLGEMSKSELLALYVERIQVIVNVLPNIAFATKPGVTMRSLGIPETKDNVRALQDNREASQKYFSSAVDFQKIILPYSDTRDLIAAILFYEETLKSLHTYNDFKTD